MYGLEHLTGGASELYGSVRLTMMLQLVSAWMIGIY